MLDESNGIVGGFAIVPNYCLRDKRVKPTDKGIYAYICGNAPEFLCSEKAIASNLGICPDTVSKAIKRLTELGYVKRIQLRAEKGKFGRVNYVANPFPCIPDETQETPSSEEPLTEKPLSGEPSHLIILRINNIIETTLKGITPNQLTSDQALFEKRVLRRNFKLEELVIWEEWKAKGVDPYLILRAYVDTEYKGRKQTLMDIDNTLKAWESYGAKSYKDVENYILDKLYENIVSKIKSDNPYITDEEFEAKVSRTDAWTTLNWRDEIRKAYNTHHLDEARLILSDCPTEVFRYLSDDILEFAADYFERTGRLNKKNAALSFVEGGKAYA